VPPRGELYDPVRSGTELWHVYKEPYSPTSFNPAATGRFAAGLADPPRAMLYAEWELPRELVKLDTSVL